MMIRKAKRTDAEGCYNLVESDRDSYWTLNDLEMSIDDEDAIFLVAEENGEVVGYVQGFILPTKKSEALIHETRVTRDERRRGIGAELVDAFCEDVFKKGVEVVMAEIEPELLGFYRDSCGFKERGKWIEVGRQRE